MKASWRKGYHAKIDAQVAFEALEKIKADNGGVLTAGIIVAKAKTKSNKLHKAFEWDDAKAAHEHRLHQARKMTHSLEVVHKEAPQIGPQRQYMTVKEAPLHGQEERTVYRSTEELMRDPNWRAEVLSNAVREALAFRKKYSELSELAKVFAAMDEFVENIKLG